MANRSESISKRARFEIFKRDAFTCQYCGKRPPDTVLEVDHIHPRSKGGDNDSINLVTACYACNRGKSDRVLGSVPIRPDADLKYLEAQQEIAEAKRYLQSKEERDRLSDLIAQKLTETWEEHLDCHRPPKPNEFKSWVSSFGAEEVEEAIRIAGYKDRVGGIRNGTFGACGYITAVLRNRKNEAAS